MEDADPPQDTDPRSGGGPHTGAVAVADMGGEGTATPMAQQRHPSMAEKTDIHFGLLGIEGMDGTP